MPPQTIFYRATAIISYIAMHFNRRNVTNIHYADYSINRTKKQAPEDDEMPVLVRTFAAFCREYFEKQ